MCKNNDVIVILVLWRHLHLKGSEYLTSIEDYFEALIMNKLSKLEKVNFKWTRKIRNLTSRIIIIRVLCHFFSAEAHALVFHILTSFTATWK